MSFAQIHEKALNAARRIRLAESDMIFVLQEVDRSDGYNELGYTSLSAYMMGELNFSEASAHHFICVSRKAQKVPELQTALKLEKITISKAKTIAPVLTRENAAHWLGLAEKQTVRELERAVAQERPEAVRIEKIHHRARDHVDLSVTIRELTLEILKRAQELLRQSRNSNVTIAEVLHELAEDYLERKDPLRRAARKEPNARTEREKAMLRDGGACQFKMPAGNRCGTRYWIDVHHIQPRSMGGADSADNLVVLCSVHHKMVHDPPGVS